MPDEQASTGGDGDERSNRQRFAEAAREERPDLALLCLLIGVEAATVPSGRVRAGVRHAPVDVAADESGVLDAQIELDRLAGLLPYAPARTPERWATELRRLLGEEMGFRGNPDDYRRLESSLLQSVLKLRRGLPILLSVVWTEVARRAGAPVYGVGLPGHFVVGFGDPGDAGGAQAFADPYDGGRLLHAGELEAVVAGATGSPTALSPAMLQPAGPLDIVLRILNNIRAWAAARPEHSSVQLWALELSLLLPRHPARLRYELGQLLVERGDFPGGAAEMEEYAEAVAQVEPETAEAVHKAAHAARARLN
ncbi:transglutaminase-like domain-containing protein [Streptomyces ovatisporus]|uniref:Transglutaminase-like domain-containing protein n=1 Tax=Streptomyces ovatisporus TaxID=1128682 RepID=A0ABV9A393_9ACTN